MTKLLILPLAASLLLGGGTALAQTDVNDALEKVKEKIEQVVKPERERGEKPKETKKERCLRKHNGDESKCKKPTKLERCMHKKGWTEEQCKQWFQDRKQQLREERGEKREERREELKKEREERRELRQEQNQQ